jgi:predicted DNA-binding transcriptional regulator YafY
MRIHRLIGIILLIESRGIIKAKELAHAFETSERTIYRDIDTLCEAGLPIRSIPGPAGGFSFMDGYKINTNSLYCNDIINIFLSGMGVRPQEYTESAIALKNALLKLEKSVPEKYKMDIKKAKERFYSDPTPWWRHVIINKNFDTIRKALWLSNKLLIKYIKGNSEESERVIRPYGLVRKDSEWYLVAYCEKRNEERTFKLTRIIDASFIDERFKIPEGFSLEDYWTKNVQIFKEEVMHKENKRNYIYPVKIKLGCKKEELLKGFETINEYIKVLYY